LRYDRLNNFPSDSPPEAGGDSVAAVLDRLFRREAGRLVAILTGRFGTENLQLAEDVVQDALIKAMKTWPFTGVPDNPTAWILQAACNRAVDERRRIKIWRGKQPLLLPLIEDILASRTGLEGLRFEDEIKDSQLRMMFVCCHPGLSEEAQIALTLKVLCGFGEREIAAAFLTTEIAIAKRLGRARQFLREAHVDIEVPRNHELALRLESVRKAIYLLFNEGYKASRGSSLLRRDLCEAAIRLGEMLLSHPFLDDAQTHALLALLYLNAARMPARVDSEGVIFNLEMQDRRLWDREKIASGVLHMGASAGASELSRYHLEAGIAACHTLATSDDETNWTEILGLYDMLLSISPSPVVALNRAVALARVNGAEAGLKAIETIEGKGVLRNYHHVDAVAGHLLMEVGDRPAAALRFRRALGLATLDAERDLLGQCIAKAEAPQGPIAFGGAVV
jgi:RNA polymerase sigma factor (sigma-70 family)